MTSSFGQPFIVVVDELTRVGEARRRSVALAAELGFDEVNQGKAALVVTEAASNLVKHSGGGELILKGLADGPAGPCLEITAIDTGRGMSDLSRCMADGFSSAGSPGSGTGRYQSPFRLFRDLLGPGWNGSVGAPRSQARAQVVS